MGLSNLSLPAFLYMLVVAVNSQLLAIDFGTQFIKASVVHSGAGKSFSIVQNSKSQRKFLNALGFYAQQRFYESDALPKRTKNPQNCFLYSRLLIDFAQNPSLVKTVKKDLFLQYANQNLQDQFLAEFILKGFPQQTKELTLLEVMTMIIKYVKLQAQKFVKGPVKDAVLILPNFWTIHQRNFLLQAASVADLYILSIVNENTAASINYAVSQRTQNKTEKVLFFNVGSNSLQMTLVQYKQVQVDSSPKPVESIFVKDDLGLPYVGGLRLDSIICKHFEEIFEQKYKKKLDKRGLIKLLAQSNRVKETLSANKEASLFVEGIMDGIDFHSKMTRTQFEAKAEPIFKEITAPLKRFLLQNEVKADDLHSVQLIGGGSRIPKLQTMIADILNCQKQKIGTHINGDEAMALGGAFFAANSSKKFKVKGINLYDGFNFDIRLVLRNLDETIEQGDEKYFYKNATIFKKKNRFGLNKEVNFKCDVNLKADLYKVDLDTLEEELLKSYELDQVESFNQTDFKLSLVFTIDPLEVVLLKDSKFNYKKDEIQSYMQKVPKPKSKNISSEEKTQENSSVQKDVPNQEVDQEKDQEKAENTTDNQTQSEKSSNKTKKNQKKKKQQKIEYETVEKNKTVTKKYEKQMKSRQSYNVKGKEEKLNQRTKQMLKTYEKAQQKKRNLAEAKNKLEALIYETKDKLENQQFIKYSKQNERQNLAQLASEKQSWHDQTQSKNPEDYKREYNELAKPLERVKKRIVEHYERDHMKNRALSILKEHLNLTNSIRKGKEWITEEEVQELKETFEQAKQKINDIYESMEETEINKDTTYENKDMIREAQTAKDKYFVLKAKVKPAKKESQKQQKSDQKKSKEDDSSFKNQEDVNEDQL